MVVLEWHGFVPSEDYRAGLEMVLQLAQEQNVKYVLTDNRFMGPLVMADQAWTKKELIPRLSKTGIEKLFIVVSMDIFNAMAVQNILNEACDAITFEYQYFHSYPDGVDWLTQTKSGVLS